MNTAASARSISLLVVEDDPVDVETLRRALARTKLPYRVVNATDGVDALAILRADSTPATRRLILLDIGMPRMNGLEFLRELRADPRLKSTPVVILTTSTADEDRRQAYELHVAGYLVKPIRFDSFVELIAGLMDYWTHAELP